MTITEPIIATEALVLHELHGPLVWETLHIYDLQPNEIVVDIQATGICHTDLMFMDGEIPSRQPGVFGHEGAGIVRQTGENVTHIRIGDKVLLSFDFCERCDNCVARHPAYCDAWRLLNSSGHREDGTSALRTVTGEGVWSNFFGQSCFSRVAVVGARCAIPVPAETDLTMLAPLGCGIQTGAGAVLNVLKTQPGQSVAVFGTGAVGLAAVMAARIAGAEPIIAVDVQESRLQMAAELGATHTINAKKQEVVLAIQALTGGKSVQLAVECSGVPAVVSDMLASLCARGRAVSVGMTSVADNVQINLFAHLMGGKEYIGCVEGDVYPPEFVPWLADQYSRGKFPVDKLIKVYKVRDYEQAFADVHDGKVIKAVLDWTE
ncbi:NAD(P)-dependent alcohol dehydrogenase [Aspergillus saccharolyticus JOP 1030-1]|uniref:Alcohol dehydrogenase n=1 Tax=Aspergillus saccharolyticus JOP 1030-1 TaxID=1450539 RepID=A0A318ZHT7_9EURO|nr:alcohol dehydrogenase [Aspergillus saccharolyticus JOP 1030-1]PYH47126.1 alcohol dehydrogenase [Aspergillus saccharolyticus JOP 1030-1]